MFGRKTTDSYHVDVPDDEQTDFMCIFSFLGPLHVKMVSYFFLSILRTALSEISSIGTLLCYDAFEELRHDSFLHNGFEPLLNWKDDGFETFLAF
jgi:hypothetical protein